jgi:large conductance mechanosensitive channel
MLEELKRIRQLLEPKPVPPSPQPKGISAEFKDFIAKNKMVGLAVAFIFGVYLGQLVQALVNDLLMPIINLVLPNVPWDQIVFGPFKIGHFMGQLITFIIVAFVIFALVKVTRKWGVE